MNSPKPEQVPGIAVLAYLAQLKTQTFSGAITLASENGNQWILYLYMGRLLYATGGQHPVRRWQRHILASCPHLTEELENYLKEALISPGQCWEYEQLKGWTESNRINRETSTYITKQIIQEILFDLFSVGRLSMTHSDAQILPGQMALIDPLQLSTELRQQWQQWQRAKLELINPNEAPVIRDPEQLKEKTGAKMYHTLTQLLDGKKTLRDLSVAMGHTIIDITTSLLPLIRSGVIEVVGVDDYSAPRQRIPRDLQPTQESSLVACVDDSSWVCQSLEKLIKGAGYRFVAIQDPLRAIPTLLLKKPSLVFLDLRMPNTNGYELCNQLRKISQFKEIPIIILTGNDGIVDRVRAKLVGATDFLSKSVDDETLLSILSQYLAPTTPTSDLSQFVVQPA
jgi:chemotaxis family two-component system response regulator PixG